MTDLERQILGQVQGSIAKAIYSELVGYNKPLNKLAEKVVNDNYDEVYEIMNKAFKTVVRTEAFEATILAEFERKVAKLLVGQISGHVEKAVNRIKRDPRLKAKMILAIEDIIESDGEKKL